jgi:hypothetical protein
MKKIYTFAALVTAGVLGLNVGAQVFAQSYDSNISNLQQIESTLSNTCISPDSTTNIFGYPNSGNTTGSISTDYSISYQGEASTPISTDPFVYPTISYTPRTAPTDTTISYLDTTSLFLNTDTFVYPTISYTPRTAPTDTTISYLDTTSLFLNTDTSIYPTLRVTSSEPLYYRTISYQVNEPTINESTPIEDANSCTLSVDSGTQYPDINITVEDESIIENLPSISANLSVNDEYILYVNYGDTATVKWSSIGTSNCSLEPINKSGVEGQYVLQDIKSNVVITIHCDVGPGYDNYQIFPSYLGRVEVRVLPPTFDYLKNYLTTMQSSGSKKVNLNGTTNLIEQAQRAYDSGKTDMAQSFLQRSVSNLQKQRALAADAASKYEEAVNYLSKTLPVKVVIATDGCSVTANGTPGLILEFGGNVNMRRGYTEQAVIPEEGTITKDLYTQNGWTATGEVIDSTGLIYARETKDVTTNDCPEPPVVYDPSVYNGYPEEWATPEPGTVLDDWGYYNKTAESYVAFRVTDSGRTFPTSYGDGSEWLVNALADDLVVDIPQAGDVAVNTISDSLTPPIQYIDSVDEQGNVQMTSFSESPDGSYSGTFGGSGGTIEGFSSYMKFIRFP